jgi:hypothetical protein
MNPKKVKTTKIFVETHAQQRIKELLEQQKELNYDAISCGKFFKQMSAYFIILTLKGATLGALSGALGASMLRLIDSNYQVSPSMLASSAGGAAMMFPLLLTKCLLSVACSCDESQVSSALKLSISLTLSALVGAIGHHLMDHERLDTTMTSSMQALSTAAGVGVIKSSNYLLARIFGSKSLL